MEFENDGNPGEAGQANRVYNYAVPSLDNQNKGRGWRIFWGIFTVLSVLINIFLVLMLIGMGVMLFTGTGAGDMFLEEIVEKGPGNKRIAIINIYGGIDLEQSRSFQKQIKSATEDDNIKGLIVRVSSPGGTVSASDQIHKHIMDFRSDTNKPVVALMQSIATSGGYYASVACDTIIAEPTAITGSIGVIMGYLVVEELFEQKLGIQPVIVKSGKRKDWPSGFRMPSEEELRYLDDTLITPAYERFVGIVNDGREQLTMEQVKTIADGSIFMADKALELELIDEIGYLDDAVDTVKKMAGIKEAQVFEYRRAFSLSDIFSSAQSFKIDRMSMYEFTSPDVLYLWNGQQ